MAESRAPAVYLHIPFCLKRCPYCSFFSQNLSREVLSEYLEALDGEIILWQKKDPSLKKARTLYFGGGTPSLLSSEQILRISGHFGLEPGAEVTLEVNPEQINPKWLGKLATTPVNRLSLGLQSFDDEELAWLGRRSKSEDYPRLVKLCRDFGFENISLDFIYGLPGSDAEGLKCNLDKYLELEPEHISAYLLTPDEDTALGKKLASGEQVPLPDDENLAAHYKALRQKLLAAGFEHYEISNFCRPGRSSIHNLSYWKNQPYLGLGASASGWLPPLRYTNPASQKEYTEFIQRGELPFTGEEYRPHEAWADHFMMGMRLLEGVDLDELQNLYGCDPLRGKEAEIQRLRAAGLIELVGRRLRLTPAALFVSNAVIAELL
ncbi:MAG: radical SAM family heme chaperone HemW [Candidatus Cloacimonadaceae bacterium]|jgi:oxygen-independent coproporphyrinogen-3 oxidase|nr:radical SAM family heme chaperone HemW [Candidatus Cloacimonadota bacterium]MDX9949577.1 radical SAM family heme chaperone HemW [Candidatus Syntrophosphaera sp.]NLN84568.1 radical SAM family heme chaperone HemW [Candidatus Cloacimonadota bacterium]